MKMCANCQQEYWPFRQTVTRQLNVHARKLAELLEDTTLLSQLSTGNMVAIKAQGLQALFDFPIQSRGDNKKHACENQSTDNFNSSGVLAQHVTCTEKADKYYYIDTALFKMADISKVCTTRME